MNGTSHSWSEPSTCKKKPSTQWSRAAHGRRYGSQASRNHTNSCSQSSTIQQRASVHNDAKKANISTERGTKQGDSLSTRRFNSLLQYIMKPVEGKRKKFNHGVRLVEHHPMNLSTSGSQTTSFSSGGSLKHDDHHHAQRPHHSYNGTRPATALHENENHLQHDIITNKSSTVAVKRDEHRDPSARSGNQMLWSTHHLEKRSPSRVGPPHHVCVGNFHQPQAGVDVTNTPAERQTGTLRRHGDPMTPLRIRNVDDDGRYEEEAPDNATTDDEDDHTNKQRRMPRASTTTPSNPTTPTTNQWTTRLSTKTKTSTSTKKAATTQTVTLASEKSQKTIQKTR